jgi:excisionase family DNA binding protein
MPTLVSLAEAASYLGVSKATLRNWDKEGKLRAHRHPINKYRAYDLEELRQIKRQSSLLEEPAQEYSVAAATQVVDVRTAKRIVARLHSIIRDNDGNSSIVHRFDELTKFLYLKLIADKDAGTSIFKKGEGETASDYVGRIRQRYEALASRNAEVIPKQFATLCSSDQTIADAGIVLANVCFDDTSFDVKGVAYEEVIRGTFDKGDNQQFFTPHQVVSFMVEFMKPLLRGVIADPACGTGGFLAEVVRSDAKHSRLVGLEIDERLQWATAINLLVHGAKSFDVRHLPNGGTLGLAGNQYESRFDAIITNPPFGSDYGDADVLPTYALGVGRTSRRRGILFIERCWLMLKENGHLAIIIDEGVLNLPSAEDVRSFILSRFEILAIVNLPETAFMPYANVNASILFLKKTAKANRSKTVFFGRAENIGRRSNGDDDIVYDENGIARPNSDLPHILDVWRAHLRGMPVEPSESVFIADVQENLQADASLRLDFRYHHPSRNLSRSLLQRSGHPIVTLADLCDERNESLIPSTEMQDQVILYTGLANIEAGTGVAHQVPTPTAALKSAVKRYEPNDIIFARMRPNLRKVALMDFEEGGYVSPECSVLMLRSGDDGEPLIDPLVLASVLRSDLVFGQIMHLIAGIGRPRLNVTDLRRVRIPVPPRAAQAEVRKRFERAVSAAKTMRSKATALLSEADALRASAVADLSNSLIDA